MDNQLPPFGIRHLLQDEPYSVVQVNEKEYDHVISQQPEATLSYIDDDDGENVTVGSSLELKQRLQDPTPTTAPAALYFNPAHNEYEDKLIHLFDIQKTNPALSSWNHHHQLYKARLFEDNQKRNKKDTSTALNATNDISRKDTDAAEATGSKGESVHPVSTSSNKLTIDFTDAVPDMVENLANLLHITSETLRLAATKSRETNTTPIEDVLAGFGNIVTEIGRFSLSLLGDVNDNQRTEKDQSPQPQPQDLSNPISPLSAQHSRHQNPSISDVCDSVSSVSTNMSEHKSVQSDDETKNFKAMSSHVKTEAISEAADVSISPISTSSVPKDQSILDQDTDDLDFSRRYPPLVSLRRAHTTAALHSRYTTPSTRAAKDQDLNSNDTRRHPDRPTPQVFDAETQRRRYFAQSCFPAQHVESHVSHGVSDSHVVRKATSMADFTSKDATSKHTSHVKFPAPIPALSVRRNNDTVSNAELSARRSLPGAWPEPLQVQTTPNGPSGESSGAFFNRMMRDNHSRHQKHTPDASERLTRHRSFSRPTNSNNPFSDLNRSHTVSNVKNPASRLNRPFDPLYPIVSHSNVNLQQPKKPELSSDAPTVHNRASQSQPQPLKLSEPARTTLRPFSPVWEEHLDDTIRRTETKPTTQTNHLDQNGESRSMYSPPPRHMRSVPNFATNAYVPVAQRVIQAPRADNNVSLGRSASVKVLPTTNDAVSAAGSSFQRSLQDTPIRARVLNDPRMRMAPASLSFPPFPPEHTTSSRLGSASRTSLRPLSIPSPDEGKSQTNMHESNARLGGRAWRASRDAIDKCLSTLVAMGYGDDDENLKSRLPIYAELTEGDIMKAVDMIEEEVKAFKQVKDSRFSFDGSA